MADVRSLVEFAHREEEEAQAKALATKLNLEYVQLTNYPFSPSIVGALPADAVARYLVVPFRREQGVLSVATPQPESEELRQYLAEFSQANSVELRLAVCSTTSYAYAQKTLELLAGEAARQAVPAQPITHDAIATFRDKATLAKKLEGISTSEQLDILFAGAMAMEATDIHIEPGEQSVVIRFRIDGVLQTIATLPADHYRSIRSRIKYLAHLTLDIQAKPQDGRFEYQTIGKKFDVRVSSLPTNYGETFVLRLLTGGTVITLDQLGFTAEQMQVVRSAISKPNGLILNTGPTGSGKTTTLYAILAELNKPGVKIITIEDPIEYRIEGIQQSQVEPERGYDFATALRSSLRQDPDIIMVGEIRDPETATIAIQAAMTGHLVLATLHTNSAGGAVPRLLDMGVKTYLLAGVINLIIAQRLVRKLANPQAQGDDRFKGRIAIAELLVPNHDFETLMQQKASVEQFEEVARTAGMKTMFEDGMDKVRAGLTTEDEVRRVAEDLDEPPVAANTQP